MAHSYFKIMHWGLLLAACVPVVCSYERCPCPKNQKPDMKFINKVGRFWAFKEESKRWEEVVLPFDLVSCVNNSCSVVGSIDRLREPPDQQSIAPTITQESVRDGDEVAMETAENSLPIRKRISIAKFSESSIWVTGPSGSIYERFWNGVHWVIAPHELPISAGPAMSVFVVNQTVLALSEAGVLYELQLNESQQVWSKVKLTPEQTKDDGDFGTNEEIKSYAISNNGEKLYLSSRNGMLIEVSEFHPLRWTNHGKPPGARVVNMADGDSIRPGAVFTISSTGELFEFDKNSKPPWKKHIWSRTTSKEIYLANSKWSCSSSLVGAHSKSLFLLSKDGLLLERHLHQRKWKWVVHGAPQGNNLSAITRIQQDEANGKRVSIFVTASTGAVFEYQPPKNSGFNPDDQIPAKWVNHMHPEHAKVARGIPGIQLQFGRMVFPLDDGRLGELHLSSIGGEDLGPTQQNHIRRKLTSNYEWSILDAPETEGWNAEYCNDEVGLLNCFSGTKVATKESESDASTGRHRLQAHQVYLFPNVNENQSFESTDDNSLTASTSSNFRMRALHSERTFVYVSENGLIFEYQNDWTSAYGSGIWLQHECPNAMKGALGYLNGSMYMVDKHDNLLVRERDGNELSWINCTNMKNGKQVATGAPWDSMPGRERRITTEDALFFVNKKGKLLQLTVALRKVKWKDCRRPPNTKIAFIVDQGILRMNIVFVVGRNGRIYQYNRVTELWHEHYQSPHLVLSRLPGTARRSSDISSTGSLFMILENGGLVEYHWGQNEGWMWVEHGTPNWDVKLVAAPGPCFDDGQIFLVGSDGQVYRRYLDKKTWKWASNGYPQFGPCQEQDHNRETFEGNNQNCNEKVKAVRPIPFSEHSVIFELQDGRLAELRRSKAGEDWQWTRIIGTPNSLCPTGYMMALAF